MVKWGGQRMVCQNGYSQLAGGVEKVHSDLQHQRSIIQSLVEAENMYKNELGQLKTNLQRYLEERAQETPAVKAIVDNSIQKKKLHYVLGWKLARMEILATNQGMAIARQASQGDEAETALPDIAALHERMDGIGCETLRIARQADDSLVRLEQVEGLCEHFTDTWNDAVPVNFFSCTSFAPAQSDRICKSS